MAWLNNYIRTTVCDAITHPCPNFNDLEHSLFDKCKYTTGTRGWSNYKITVERQKLRHGIEWSNDVAGYGITCWKSNFFRRKLRDVLKRPADDYLSYGHLQHKMFQNEKNENVIVMAI